MGVRLGVNLKFKAPIRNKMMWSARSLFFQALRLIQFTWRPGQRLGDK